MSKQFSFEELDKAMTKIDPLGSIMTENTFSKIDEWISMGNYLLNAHVSGSIFKGIPNSRSIMLSGESGTGKTFVALNICREAQKMGYHIIYGDSEAAVDEELMVKFGVDPSRVRYQPLKTALHVRHFTANLCKSLKEKKAAGFEIPKILFVLDSMGNLATEKELNDALSGLDKRDMTKQQNLRSMFRVITMDLAELKIPFVVTNHTYQCITGEQLVITKTGNKPISEIQVGEEILSIEGFKPVVDTFSYDDVPTIVLNFEDGTSITASQQHKFMVKNESGFEWKAVEDLKEGDEILQFDTQEIDFLRNSELDMIYNKKWKYHGQEFISSELPAEIAAIFEEI